MNVEEAVRSVTVPSPAQPSDPPLLGRDRPLCEDERQFLLGAGAVLVVLSAYIVTFLLLGRYAWS